MSKPKIKICGMTDLDNISMIAELKPDFLGFIFYDRSPRNINGKIILPELAIQSATKNVGVFVNEPLGNLVKLIIQQQLEIVQLHGDESELYLTQLKSQIPNLKIIKAFRISEDFDFSLLNTYQSADYFLFDNYQSQKEGGTGSVFKWQLLDNYQLNIPYFLSGGLNLENLAAALEYAKKDSRVYALDFNSGLESSSGIKDGARVLELFQRLDG